MNVNMEDPHQNQPSAQTQAFIPVIEERLDVSKRSVPTGTVRLQKHVEQRVETVSLPLTDVRWQVEHVPIDRVVATAPEVRYVGETTIYPILEERVIVTRELVLKEELHVTRLEETRINTSSHTLLHESVQEERTAPK